MSSMQPLFLFSLPRAGSTLVQRVLGAHEQVATVAEPWLLLPQLYALRHGGTTAEYEHAWSVNALHDFFKALPQGEATYRHELAAFTQQLYEQAGGARKRYFLDKTPRYHVLADEIIQMFPQGRFIFLWRNPLAVAASMMQTWAAGRWNLFAYKLDLYRGQAALIEAAQRHSDRVLAVKYEDLVTQPEQTWPRIFAYLDLPFDPALLERFASVQLEGGKGDPTGVKAYRALSSAPLDKWRQSFANPLRQRWARGYLHWLGGERLAAMGYDIQVLLRELASAPRGLRGLASDTAVRLVLLAHEYLLPPRLGRPALRYLLARLKRGSRAGSL